jgi:hypothetical protein
VRAGQARVEWGVLVVAQCNSMSSPFGNHTQPTYYNLLTSAHAALVHPHAFIRFTTLRALAGFATQTGVSQSRKSDITSRWV